MYIREKLGGIDKKKEEQLPLRVIPAESGGGLVRPDMGQSAGWPAAKRVRPLPLLYRINTVCSAMNKLACEIDVSSFGLRY